MQEHDYLREVWEVNSVEELTPVEAGLILDNAEEGYPWDTNLWLRYAEIHGLPDCMTAEEFRRSHLYQAWRSTK